jgi:hypothetical protein
LLPRGPCVQFQHSWRCSTSLSSQHSSQHPLHLFSHSQHMLQHPIVGGLSLHENLGWSYLCLELVGCYLSHKFTMKLTSFLWYFLYCVGILIKCVRQSYMC